MTLSFRLPSPITQVTATSTSADASSDPSTLTVASLSDMRTAVSGLSFLATDVVSAVRAAFIAGVAPLQTVSSGSVSSYISSFPSHAGAHAQEIIESTSRFGLSTAVGGTSVSPPRLELDHVEVASDVKVGVIDSYYTRVIVSIPSDQLDRVTAIRIMRANGGVLDVPKPAVSALEHIPLGLTKKTFDPVGLPAIRSSLLGLGSKLSLFIRDDSFTSTRSVISSGNLRPVPSPTNTNRIGTSTGLISISNADPTVLENLQFYVTQRTLTSPVPPSIPLSVGKIQGLNVLAGSSVSSTTHTAVQVGNAQGFREIARISPRPNVGVGSFVEIEVRDPTVMYGSRYTYYASCLSALGIEGPRSRLVQVDVVRHIPPPPPKVFYSVVAGRPRFSVRATGSFVDHVEMFRRGGQAPELVRLFGSDSSMITEMSPDEIDSGFIHIGDLGVGTDRSVTFVDPAVLAGQEVDYRFYTVDAYGNKCQTPFSCSIFLPDHGKRIPLGVPSITAESGVSPRSVNIRVACDDPRVTSFKVARREARTVEKGFRQPSQPDFCSIGRVDPKRARSRIGPSLPDSSQKAWLGVFVESTSGSAKMVDTAVNFDRVYQYSVVGVDVRGNETSQVLSQLVQVSVKPVSDPPTSLSASVDLNQAGSPVGVTLSWIGGTNDFSPNHLIEDQDVLAATSVRSVYQVERREVGKAKWEVLPATTATFFSDPVSSNEAPPFRPSYAVVGNEYEYRVVAMQSGGFISPHTDPVGVVVVPPISPPDIVWVRSFPLSIRPARIVVSWNYDGPFVDGWEIDRAVVNKIYGSKIVSTDSREARLLPYSRISEVKRESSNATGLATALKNLDPAVFVGNRFFIDQAVDPVNSYIYRVRAVDIAGKRSEWTYGGISLTDSPHDRKFYSTLSDQERVSLSNDPRPILTWRSS